MNIYANYIFVRRVFRAYGEIVKMNLDLTPANFSPRVNISSVQNCWKNLNNIDRKLFSFDMNEVVWNEYFPLVANSIREYLRILLKKRKAIRLAVFW